MVNVVLKQTSSGSVIQEMSGGDKDYIKNVILTDFSSSDTGVGTVSVNPTSTTGLTLVGTFVDTNRNTAPGGEPPNTNVLSTNYNFYQDLQTATENITDDVRPLGIDSSGEDFQRMNDTKINEDFIRHTQILLAMGDVGSYKLQPSAPTGGTWVEKATITDSLQSGTASTTKLWRKTAPASLPATVRPLKYAAASINEMTDVDIKKFTARLRNRIVENGVGQYQLSTNAPTSGGTWVQAGQSIADTRYQLQSSNFSGPSYQNTFTGSFTNSFTGYFTRNYISYYQPSSSVGTFEGTVAKNFTGTFNNTFTGTFTSSFTGLRVQNTTETISTMKLWVRIF